MTGEHYNLAAHNLDSFTVERQEFRDLLGLLKSGQSALITGGRRLGKSVLLEQIQNYFKNNRHAPSALVVPIYVDLMMLGKPVTAVRLFNALIHHVPRALDELCEEVGAGEKCPPPPDAWKTDPCLDFCYYINGVLDELDNKVGRIVILYLLDECEALLGSEETNNLLAHLRSLLGPAMHGRVRLVISGFRDIMEYEDPETGTSPFYNLLTTLPLTLLQEKEFGELVRPLLESLPSESRQSVRDRLWEATGGHPCIVQAICYLLSEKYPPEAFDAASMETTKNLQARAFKSWVQSFKPEDHELFRSIMRGDPAPAHNTSSAEFLQYCGVLTANGEGLRAPCEIFNAWYEEHHSASAKSSSTGRPSVLAGESEDIQSRGPAESVANNFLPEMSMTGDFNFKDIHGALVRRYNFEELHDLCSALGVPFEDLGAMTLSGKAREMIYWLHRRRRLKELEPHLEAVKVVYGDQVDNSPTAASQPGSVTHDPRTAAQNPGQTSDAPASISAAAGLSVTTDPKRVGTADKSRSTSTPSETPRKNDTGSRQQEGESEGREGSGTGRYFWVHLVATIIIGAALGTFFVWVFFYSPDSLPPYKQRILAFFSALFCGLFAFFLTGAIGLDSKALRTPLGDITLKATGGLAIFVLVLLWWLSPLTPVPAKENSEERRTTESSSSKGDITLRPFVPWQVPGVVNSLTLDASGEGGAIAVETGAVHVWQTMPNGEPPKLSNTGEPRPVRSVSLGTNREMIATGSADGTVRLFRAGASTPPEVVKSHSSQVFEVYLSRDGRRLVTTGVDAGNVKSARLWGIGSRVSLDRTLRAPNFDDDILAVSPDLQLVAIYAQRNRRIELWSIADGRFVNALKDSDPAVTGGGTFSEDAKLFAAGGADGAARLWRTADGERLKNFNGPSQRVASVAINPAGQLVAAGYTDGTLYIWSVGDENLLKQIKVHEQGIFSLTFSRNGRILASGGEDGMVQLFEVTLKS